MWFAALVAALLVLTSLGAEATQIKEVADGAEVSVRMSSVDLNRFQVPGDRIVNLKAEEGRFDWKNNEQNGDLYIGSAGGSKEEAIFYLITEKGYTYRIFAKFEKVPGEQISLINPGIGGSKEADEWERQTPYQEAVVKLLSGMATGQVLKGYQSDYGERVVEKSPLLVMSVGRYTGRQLEGEVFFVRNDSTSTFRVEEARFKAPRVAAVYVQQPDLKPGETTRVLLVSRRGQGGANNGK